MQMMQNFEKDPKMNLCATFEQLSAEAFNKIVQGLDITYCRKVSYQYGIYTFGNDSYLTLLR